MKGPVKELRYGPASLSLGFSLLFHPILAAVLQPPSVEDYFLLKVVQLIPVVT